ncbi:MAG: 4Fe-4S dicluster domain-containing protein [Chloroflexi bacterium]|nr:4Fe-4S dicluster domain-containing protein [Chloroflexota bacterium]
MSNLDQSLQRELETYARANGADLFGIADLAPARDFIMQFGGAFLANFPRSIALAVKTSTTVVDQLPHRKDPVEHRTVFYTYKAHSAIIGERLERISSGLVDMLERAGYRALPVFRGDANEEQLAGAFSQKLGAHLAGLGWIGKNCLFISPALGPRLRLANVLTDAPLACGAPVKEQCGECRLCVDICPVKAFTGASFDPAEPREARYNAHLCKEYNLKQLTLMGVHNRTSPGHACGLCLYVCPYGKNEASR